ncbi:MAG TPA: type IV pilus twitching motility protein PilT [Planctomycetota bacterium]|jgi:twitching motility protein PilT|nr:type IV pilus twitching motility protein PilT [Planctomycetota bacterium]
MAKIDAFFRLMNSQGASDLHIMAGGSPCLRIHGDVEPIKYHELTNDELLDMLVEITPEHKMKEFQETGDVDFAYELPGVSRYRANFLRQSNGVGAVFRQIPEKILTIDQLGLPDIARRFALMEKGLVLVTGPTGSGKSTTLAAIIDYANRNRRDHIITIEDPIEFKHRRVNCIISHREVGHHTRGFTSALRGALREDPDIIMVGEMRDLETITLALEAASTGHLVFATLHTQSATKTVDRIIDVFPTEAKDQVRTGLSESLKGVLSQSLLKRCDNKGRVAALEIMVGTPAMANLIREGKTHQLQNVIQTGRRLGMRTLDDHIEELLQRKIVTAEEAFDRCIAKERFVKHLSSVPEEWQEVLSKEKTEEAKAPAGAKTAARPAMAASR